MSSGQPGRLHHASAGWLPIPRCGIAMCLNRATGTTGLSPAGLQPCRLLQIPVATKIFLEASSLPHFTRHRTPLGSSSLPLRFSHTNRLPAVASRGGAWSLRVIVAVLWYDFRWLAKRKRPAGNIIFYSREREVSQSLDKASTFSRFSPPISLSPAQ